MNSPIAGKFDSNAKDLLVFLCDKTLHGDAMRVICNIVADEGKEPVITVTIEYPEYVGNVNQPSLEWRCLFRGKIVIKSSNEICVRNNDSFDHGDELDEMNTPALLAMKEERTMDTEGLVKFWKAMMETKPPEPADNLTERVFANF